MTAALRPSSSPLWAVVPAALAALATGARWLVQGSGNLISDVGRRFYVPDPDLGWRLADGGPLWLGLDAVAVTGAVAVGVLIGSLLVARRERRVDRSRLRAPLWVAAVLPLAIPVAAFASGLGPEGGRERAPDDLVVAPTAGVEGNLPGLPAGRYRVVRHPGSAVAATVTARGETFEVRFTGADGFWTGDPSDLRQPMQAEISVDAGSAETGIDLRTRTARDDLRVRAHPRIGFRLDRLRAARQESADRVAFAAAGTVILMGRSHRVDVEGILRAPDAAGLERLDLVGDEVLLVQARTSVPIAELAVASRGELAGTELPVAISLVLVHDGGTR